VGGVTIHPKFSLPVANHVKVWDSFCNWPDVNPGPHSLAYIQSNLDTNQVPSTAVNKISAQKKQTNKPYGIFESASTSAHPAWLSIFFGKRIRLVSLNCNFPKNSSNNCVENGLKLYVDGVKAAEVTTTLNSDHQVVDLLDWYCTSSEHDIDNLDGSNFRIEWPNLTGGKKARCGRVTVGYTEEDSSMKFWKSNRSTHHSDNWVAGFYDRDSRDYDDNKLTALSSYVTKLKNPGNFVKPRDMGHAINDHFGVRLRFKLATKVNLAAFIINLQQIQSGETKRRVGVFQLEGASTTQQVWRLLAETKVDQVHSTKLNMLDYRRTDFLADLDCVDLIILPYNYAVGPIVNESVFDSIDIYYLNNTEIAQKTWESTNRIRRDNATAFTGQCGPSTDAIATIGETSGSTSGHTSVAITEGLPAYWSQPTTSQALGRFVKINFSGDIVMTSFNFQTVRDGFDERGYHNIQLRCHKKSSLSDTISNYAVDCSTPVWIYDKVFQNHSQIPSDSRIPFYPGDHIEMFDHKVDTALPFIVGSKFALVFAYTAQKARIGKISIGYHDVDDEDREYKWTPGMLLTATMSKKGGTYGSDNLFSDTGKQRKFDPSFDLINQNLCTAWASSLTSGDRAVKVVFKEAVKIRNVIMGTLCQSSDGIDPDLDSNGSPIPIENQYANYSNRALRDSYKNVKLFVTTGNRVGSVTDGGGGSTEEEPPAPPAPPADPHVAKTNSNFVMNREFIHFFSHSNPEVQNSSKYRQGVETSGQPVVGDTVELVWTDNNKHAIISTLEIIYSKVVHNSDTLSQYACLATQNVLRSRHENITDSSERYVMDDTSGNKSLVASAQEHARWLKTTNNFKHVNERSSRRNSTTYCSVNNIGENLAKFKWKTAPTDAQKRAIMSFAAEEWYREHLNFDVNTGGKNGNIYYEGQIGHFVQIARKNLNGKNKVGIGFDHNDATMTSYVVVQYEKGTSDLGSSKINNSDRVGAEYLTFNEEVQLREAIKKRVDKKITNTLSASGLATLKDNTNFYITKTREKMNFYLTGTVDYTEPEYTSSEWTTEINTVNWHLNNLEYRKNNGWYDTSFLESLMHVIPRSLAEQRFGLLQLNSIFMSMFDLLSLKVMLNKTTRGHTLLPNKTIIQCLEDTTLPISSCSFKKELYTTCAMEEAVYKKVLRVLLGFWSVRKDVPMQGLTKNQWTEDAKKVCVFLKTVFGDSKIAEHWAEDFNSNNGSNDDMDKLWWENKDGYTMPAGYPDYSAKEMTLDQQKAADMFDSVSLMSKC